MSARNYLFNHVLWLSLAAVGLCSCKSAKETSEKEVTTVTPVTLTHIVMGPIGKTIPLNAVSSFLRKNIIKSSVTGIIQDIMVNLGDSVKKDQILCTLKTKEAVALDASKDTSLFRGEVRIRATKSGIISSLTHQKGDYVLEGDELAQLSEQNSLVFLLSVPFELNPCIRLGDCRVMLPDGKSLDGKIDRKLAVMDASSQTINYVIIPDFYSKLPENLIARILIQEKS